MLRVLDGNEIKLWSSPSLSVLTVFVDLFFIHTISVSLISDCFIEQYFCCIFIVQRHEDVSLSMPGRTCQDVSVVICD